MQIMIFTKKDCNHILNPFKGLIKQKLTLAITIPSSLLHALLIISIKDLYVHQQSVQLDVLNIQLLDKRILGHISYVQML